MSRKPSTTSAPKRRAKQNDTAATAIGEPLKNPEPTPPQPQLRRPAHYARRELTANFLDVLCADFAAHGADAVRACREEQPQGYLRLLAALLSKEFDPNDNPLKDIPDAELDRLIEFFRERLASQGDSEPLERREAPASN